MQLSLAAKRLVILGALCAGCTALCALFVATGWRRLQAIESYTEDLRLQLGRKCIVDDRLVFIGIDQPTYDSYYGEDEKTQDPVLGLISGQWPWSREVWAIAIERLVQAGAKAVALDLIFANPGVGDDALRSVVEKYKDRVVLGANIMDAESDRGPYVVMQFPAPTILDPGPHHPMQDVRIGYVNFKGDQPGDVIRRAIFHQTGDLGSVLPPDVRAESLTARMLRQAGMPDAIPKDQAPQRFRYSAPPGEGYRMIPVHQILHSRQWKLNYANGAAFKDKLVIIGPAANVLHDEHPTPFNRNMRGPEIHLNALSAALHDDFLHDASRTTNLLLTLWAGLVSWLLNWRFAKLFQRFMVALLVLGLYLLTAQLLYDRASVFFAISAPSTALLASTLSGLVYDFNLARRDKAQLRRTLERYVAKDVVRELIDNPQTYLNSLIGVRKPVTVFFSDIRGFTSLTEGLSAVLLVKQLNEYFQEMVRIVVNHRGRLDKFIGDAVMADWGSFVSGGVELDAERAVLAALQMREGLIRLNQQWQSKGLQTLSFGIGINHGEVIVGNLGSEEKMEVSVIGDAVNLASRLESLTKNYQLDLLVGESVAALVKNRFLLRSVDLVKVVGKTKPVEVFTVLAGSPPGGAPPAWLDAYHRAIHHYRTQEFKQALACFQDAKAQRPEDSLIDLYLDRCANLIKSPPGPGWSGVFEMTKK